MTKESQRDRKPAADEISPAALWFRRLDTELCALLAIVGVWIIAALLIDPRGDFPLNDDWCYGKTVLNLVKDHELKFVGPFSMTLFTQMLWGALFVKLFGFSFTVLRISTLVLGLVGLLATYGLLKELRVPRWVAVMGCLTVGLNALYLSLSYSFMTDVPFAVLATIAMYAYVRALKQDSVPMIIVGTLVAIAATLTRQLGVILPIGFAIAYMVKNGFRVRTLLTVVIPVAAVVGTLIGYESLLRARHILPPYYNLQSQVLSAFMKEGFLYWLQCTRNVFVTAYLYLGLFLLPFLILALPGAWRGFTSKQRKIIGSIAAVSVPCVGGVLIWAKELMPIMRTKGTYLQPFGIGPATLPDYFDLKVMANMPPLPIWFWMLVTIAACIGGGLLIVQLGAAITALAGRDESKVSRSDKSVVAMFLSVSLMYLAPLVPLTAFIYFDRYFIPPLMTLAVLIGITARSVSLPKRASVAVVLLMILLSGMFSIGATHDYLSWNRLRWQAAKTLMSEGGVQPNEIQGGYEFNGWHNYLGDRARGEWNTMFDDYAITFGPMYGFDEMKTYKFRRWIPAGSGEVHVLSKSLF